MSGPRHVACVALLALGCGASQPDPKTDTDAGTGSDAGRDMTSADLAIEGELQIGTNPVGESMPGSFTAMADGAQIPWTFGVQGSWMVVLAFRTHDLFEGPFDVVAEISLGGVDSGSIWLEAQETFPGGDGWDYYYNLFLPIDDQPPPGGSPVHIVMRVTDENGTTAEREHDVASGPADGP